jgi:octaprenyl-diphosphate synthase
MPSIKEIQAPIAEEMKAFSGHFREILRSDVTLLDIIMRYIVKRKGKQMRPIFVFLSAKIHGGCTEKTYTAASLIELLHTATLVHDDVVDESNLRRGFFSIQTLWKKKVAVLVGDYLLSRGLLTAVDAEAFDLLKLTSKAVKEMSEGELLQIEKARHLNITEDIYFEIIRRKTASLISACCACGAASTGASQEQIDTMWAFGEKTGLAFQIKDDLLDLGDGKTTGKPTGQDIREKKLTLPLIHTLEKADRRTRKRLLKLVKRAPKDPKAVKEVIQAVIEGPGIGYARNKMAELRNEAVEMLDVFEDTESRNALINMLDFTIERNR